MTGLTRAKDLTVLLIGKGAREHALAWKLSEAPSVKKVLVFPGNGGTQRGNEKISNLEPDIEPTNYLELARIAADIGVGLAVVGPDDAVVDGIESFFRQAGIPCFAPTKEAAELEGSKAFAKNFMKRHDIPTAAYQSFDDLERAKTYVQQADHRVVIKADGLAAGKGVVLPGTKEEAIAELESIMKPGGKFAAAGTSVVIEEFMEGDEISILTFSDGKTFQSLPPGQDHKRIFEGNKGPNTGGMGVYSPVPFATQEILDEIDRSILQPTFEGLREEGRPFVGLLFTGVMITSHGPKVIEYNVRFGDPETQSAMMLLSLETDLADIFLACSSGTLEQVKIGIRIGYACNVVIASQGYPGKYATGEQINLRPYHKDVQVFHAGTYRDDEGQLRTGGGRVISVAAWGNTLEEAVKLAYESVQGIHFEGMFFRKDIAAR
ncbi:phosphoribosylamine-glycine ligase [Fusarium albosuccineum]|uniref:phosphoribosylamine--glycine ligase n=1 Tax=Fusarium albosuccineum TaxID=1237068 RepID=A0A8H4PE14_9HYPO|nr:phosphoribosylamine-glycine ligase [Fusarium albosuccineum]